MCFYHDYDWSAEVEEIHDRAASAINERCYECGSVIPPGVRHLWVFQQEHESCTECDTWYYEADEKECDGFAAHSFGETFEARICEQCEQIRSSIQRLEESRGCHGAAAMPGYGELRETFTEHMDADDYVGAAPPMLMDHMVRALGWNRPWEVRSRRRRRRERMEHVELGGSE